MDENEMTVEVESTDENLFEDVEDTTETAEDTPEVETTETPVENPFELQVKFNGEERTLNEDDARMYAQKGMNYDRFYEPLERLARMNNMSVGDYINQLNDTQVQYEVEKEKDNLRNDPKYENVSDEVLDEIASARVKDFMGQRDQYYADQTQKQADEQQQRVQREVDHFLEEYPEFKDKGPETLDPKVFEFVKQGYTLLEAYNKFQRMNVAKSQAESKAKASQLNETNRKKSLGDTTNAGGTSEDAFLSGFLN